MRSVPHHSEGAVESSAKSSNWPSPEPQRGSAYARIMDLRTRTLEPELMDDPAQARAYSEADFSEAHQAFADEVARRFPTLRDGSDLTILDAGCGPADVTVRVALACPSVSIVGVDGAREMLRLGRQRIAAAGLERRVVLEYDVLPSESLLQRSFDGLVSNSLLHHLAEPGVLWQLVHRCVRPGGPVAVMDLRRPSTTDHADRLVQQYAADAPDVLKSDFRNSLCAAFRVDEVRAQLEAAGLPHLLVDTTSDRHLLVSGRR
jgi:ubiquinone/menaquinone biosynthesis C-methylase UbiE